MTPAVSVLLPVRNGMPYMPRAVESVLAQTCADLELLVVDDGSTDGTGTYLRSVADPRVRVLTAEDRGLAAALNAGLAAASAPFVARQDADDWSAPTRLAKQLAFLTTHPEVDVLATAVDFVDADDRAVDDGWTATVRRQWDSAVTPAQIAELMPLTCCLFHATVVARHDVLSRAGGYDHAMVPAEDYDLWLRLLPGHQFARLPERLYTVRVHGESSSARNRTRQIDRVLAAKLRFVRRMTPSLSRPATLACTHDDRGAARFRAVAPAEGFAVIDDVASADVVAVTDFSQLPLWARRLAADRRRAFGNIFVRTEQRRP